uniref:E3 ubiquitin-protein ligase TRAIP-like n=1 Tax=Ciona intestinalis TaxID=7719 RepID=UPI000180D1A6|nr:E3 ubiquitin-protein ligase TRAIP-like [Ciona intestinalis]|eukprot:XP_002131236.1 E3 ubiquitin-protein ligase TRAIP-like [Ciona intestinalis]
MSFRGNCVICTDYFDTENDISVTPCGHLFHALCLNTWITTSTGKKSCPQCRTHITMKQIIGKIYLNQPHEEQNELDPYVLKNKVDELNLNLKKKEKEKTEFKENLTALENVKDTLKKQIKKLKQQLTEERNKLDILKTSMNVMKTEVSDARLCKEETKKLRHRLRTLEKLEVVLTGQQSEVDNMMEQYTGGSQSAGTKQLATFCIAMKQEYELLKESKNKMSSDLMKLRRDLHRKEEILLKKHDLVEELESANSNLRSHEESLLQENKSLKHKIKALQMAISSPSDTRASAVSRLIAESPAPEFLTPLQNSRTGNRDWSSEEPILMKNPTLSSSFLEDDEKSPKTSPLKRKNELPEVDSPATKARKLHCLEYGIPYVKIKSTVGTFEENPPIRVFSNRFKKNVNKKPSIPLEYETKYFNKVNLTGTNKPSSSKISFSSTNNSNFNKFSGTQSKLNTKRFNRLKRV